MIFFFIKKKEIGGLNGNKKVGGEK